MISHKQIKEFYLVANVEYPSGMFPLKLYSNGDMELIGIIARYKLRTIGKEYYEGIKLNLQKLNFKSNDLRQDFKPQTYTRLTYQNLIENYSYFHNMTKPEIDRIWAKERVNDFLYGLLTICRSKVKRMVNKEYKSKGKKNVILKVLGYSK